jgi:hypothetical protein
MVKSAERFTEALTDSIQEKGVTLETVSEEIAKLLEKVFEELKTEFSEPEDAPTHEQRV